MSNNYTPRRAAPSGEPERRRGSSQSGYASERRVPRETGYTPRVFVFPFGKISDGAQEVIWEMGFRCVFTCANRSNQITKGEKHLVLGRFLRPHGISGEEFLAKALGAADS